MPKQIHADMLDGGPLAIRAAATALHVIRAYSVGDSYATVLANSCANVALAPADFTITTGAGAARVLTLAAKAATGSAVSGSQADLHVAVLDANTQRVLWVTDETSNAAIAVGTPLAIPAVTYTAQQPV